MRAIYEQYAFAEVIEDCHAARLIVSDEPPKKAIKRDYLKYQQLKCIKKNLPFQR